MRQFFFYVLIFVGIINSSIIIISAIIGNNAYSLANNLANYLIIILCYIPLLLLCISFTWWLIDLYLKSKNKISYITIAFCGISADAVFAIGSLLFANGH